MMTNILHNKNASTRFQVLVEIASRGPAIEQKDIAAALDITPQAISEYMKHMMSDGLVVTEGRSRYRVTSSGVNWMLKELRNLNKYVILAEKAVTDLTLNAALAEDNIVEGQEVGLSMKDGILTALHVKNGGAWGVASRTAAAGEDVGVTAVRGIISLARGAVFVAAVPSIVDGGSTKADIKRLGVLVRGQKHVSAIGIEAFAALKRIGVEPRYFYAVTQVAIEAVRYGLEVVIVSVPEELPDLMKKLGEAGIEPHFLDLRPK
jgi:putative transcriptional regulator